MQGGEVLDADKRHKLVMQKSEQLSQYARIATGQYADFVEAAAYVDGFYNNIIPAVVRGDIAASEAVGKAILRSEGKNSRLSIMNYFLRGFDYFADDWRRE
jgi:hypothetical protein